MSLGFKWSWVLGLCSGNVYSLSSRIEDERLKIFLMANLQQRLPENVPGDFFVDSTCIDCDTCSQLAPAIFRDHGEQCSVHHQPQTDNEPKIALMALVACPRGSIGSTEQHDPHVGIDAFPLHITYDVYFCGFTSVASFGGWSYLIERPTGDLLIDSPRFSSQLAQRIEAMGGVAQMLTHKTTLAHESFRMRFGTTRTMHPADGAARLQIQNRSSTAKSRLHSTRTC